MNRVLVFIVISLDLFRGAKSTDQPLSSAEQIDRRATICDECRLETKGLQKFSLEISSTFVSLWSYTHFYDYQTESGFWHISLHQSSRNTNSLNVWLINGRGKCFQLFGSFSDSTSRCDDRGEPYRKVAHAQLRSPAPNFLTTGSRWREGHKTSYLVSVSQ